MNAHDEVDVAELERQMHSPQAPVLIDVRESLERLAARIHPSIHIPQAELGDRIGAEAAQDAVLVLYCARGIRSRESALLLRGMGYTRVYSLRGGLEAWQAAGLPIRSEGAERGREWSPRYARQLRIPEVGPEGQKKLLKSSVLLVGAGGLGSPAAYYLAAAGVGTIGLIDYDRVDVTNLHRQILYRTADVGTPKVHTAQSVLQALNPDIRVVPYFERLTRDNAESIAREFDVVVDGADNFAARYLVNDIAIKLGKPNVHGSIHRFEGQVSVFGLPGGPCYRCLFPEPPPPGWAPSCAEAGVLGVLPGIIGALQATEAVKLLLGVGRSLSGRLMRIETLTMNVDFFTVGRREDCDWCNPDTPFPGLADYQEWCGDA